MKKIIVLVALCGMVSGALADPALLWGSDGAFSTGVGDCYYTNGVLIAANADWLVEIIDTADDSVLYSINNGFDQGVDGLFYGSNPSPEASGWNGLTVKTVIYDAPMKENAGLFAEFTQQTTFFWSTEPAPPGAVTYNAGIVSSTYDPLGQGIPGQWQAIPEPAVAGLLGIFGGGMLITRRIFKKEA